ncbi:MAG TPA: ABC transporter permease [Gemmatimonadaceae bacterium]
MRDSLKQLVLTRFREFVREPEALFWTLAFPILLTVGLGIAFRNRPAEIVHVAVVGKPVTAGVVMSSIRASKALAVDSLTDEEAERALRTGKVALVVRAEPGGSVTYQFDDTRPDARMARFLTDDAIQRGAGRRDRVESTETQVRERGSRYIDFVVPGLLGMGLMGNGIWGIGFSIVDARRKRLLKRLMATPMSRTEYLGSFVVSRFVLLVIEVFVLVGFSALAFGVPVRGSLWQLAIICGLGAFAFGSLGLLIAARPRTIEGASGLMNLTMMPMWILSGVFFSAENFPKAVQPLVQALPLTAVNNALRANMLRGDGLGVVGPEMAIIGAWALVCFVVALKLFRWR